MSTSKYLEKLNSPITMWVGVGLVTMIVLGAGYHFSQEAMKAAAAQNRQKEPWEV